ncbi:MAG: hypothetical protein P1U61_04800 [Legionellaceae bacterium]|nr:hypothetical protein [Legionellaceae bacterium]
MANTSSRKRRISPLSDTNQSMVATHQKRVKAKTLEDLFAHKTHAIQAAITDDQNTKSPLLANQLTGRYGLKNAAALTDFLKSPGGKALKSLIQQKLNELETLRQNSLQNEKEKQRERALVMLILGLAYEKEAAAEYRHYAIAQKQLDNKLEAQKTTTHSSQYDQESIQAYAESAEALNEELSGKAKLLASIDSEWDSLEAAIEEQRAREAFFDTLLLDVDLLFSVSPEDEIHLARLKRPELQNLRHEKQIIHRNGQSYLIPKEVDFDSLSLTEQNKAQKEFAELKPRLEKAVQASNAEETAQHEKRKANLIHRAAHLHQDIRLLTQQLFLVYEAAKLLDAALSPEHAMPNTPEALMRAHPRHNTSALFSSYKLLQKETLATSSYAQRAPILSALHEDIDTLDLETINRSGGPQFLPEMHQFKQGANNINSAGQTQTQTLLSLLKNAESLAALVSEAPTARRFHIQEQDNIPQPKPNMPQPNMQATKENQEENTPNNRFNPSPFNMRPY